MASFYIFRHGETHATWTKTPYGEAVVSAEIIVEGIKTNLDLHRRIINDKAFIEGGTNIHYLENKFPS